ncbi:peptidase M3A/M3B [Rhizoctonia solani]|nr:peptidase M3A/M3B [Rhizoctonia solani]
MSKHYEKKEPLTDNLIKKLSNSQYVNIGLFYLCQIFLGKFDIQVHMQDTQGARVEQDYGALWDKTHKETSLVKTGKNPTHRQALFGHLTGRYNTGYYSYAYSLVFVANMYKMVFKGDLLDLAQGKLYCEKTLRPGGSQGEIDLLKDFLGQEPNLEAFLEELLGKAMQ